MKLDLVKPVAISLEPESQSIESTKDSSPPEPSCSWCKGSTFSESQTEESGTRVSESWQVLNWISSMEIGAFCFRCLVTKKKEYGEGNIAFFFLSLKQESWVWSVWNFRVSSNFCCGFGLRDENENALSNLNLVTVGGNVTVTILFGGVL